MRVIQIVGVLMLTGLIFETGGPTLVAGGVPEPKPNSRFPRTEAGEEQCLNAGDDRAAMLKDQGKISLEQWMKFRLGIAYVCEPISARQSLLDEAAVWGAIYGTTDTETFANNAAAWYRESYLISNLPYREIVAPQ